MKYRYASPNPPTPAVHATGDNAATAPAKSALYRHIRHLLHWSATGYPNDETVKEIAARDYELVTYRLVEEKEYQSLQEDSDWLGHLEDAGVDNWEGISFAYDLKREAEGGED